MRKPITIQSSRFDLESIKPKMETIINAFDTYLDGYPVKTARSKHAIMGPVAKILERAQTRHWDVDSLIGYALRVHEMNPRSHGFISPEARAALELGTKEIIDLCQKIPITAVAKVIDRLDYSIYYRRRVKALVHMEKIRSAFVIYLKEQYSNHNALALAWGEKGLTFENIRYPSQRSDSYKKAKDSKKNDTDGFWNQYQTSKEEEESEE